MPRYKVKCACRDCESVWWVKKTIKLDDGQKSQIKNSICSECAYHYRMQYQTVKTGILHTSEKGREELTKVAEKLVANEPWGFCQIPFQQKFFKILEDDKRIVAEGIDTRYRGFSPVREMLNYRYRIVAAEYALKLAGL